MSGFKEEARKLRRRLVDAAKGLKSQRDGASLDRCESDESHKSKRKDKKKQSADDRSNFTIVNGRYVYL